MTATAPPVVPIAVVTAPARRGDAVALHEGTVNLEADSEAAVVAKVSGEIRETLVEEGEEVTAGQVLARLDGDRLKLQLEQALADLNKLKQEYRRNVELHDRGLVSQGAFENLRFELDALDAAYRLARLELSYTEIRARLRGWSARVWHAWATMRWPATCCSISAIPAALWPISMYRRKTWSSSTLASRPA